MANVFNSVKGLHPKRNSFSAHTYRNDFTGKLGLNYPCYIQHVAPATRIKCAAHALVRLQALRAPIMDNIDFYVHFWQLPYRLIEFDRFTAFISGEIEAADYDALFCTPYELAQAVEHSIIDYEDVQDKIDIYNAVLGDGSLLDFCGYDADLFPSLSYDEGDDVFVFTGGNNFKDFNWRNVIMYFMLHEHWYMNENVPYYDNFVEIIDRLVKEQNLSDLTDLLVLNVTERGYALLPHGWDKDYFTSGLPNVQAGDPVTLPLGGTAPVTIPEQVVRIGQAEQTAGINGIGFTLYNDVISAESSDDLEIFNPAETEANFGILKDQTSGAVIDDIKATLPALQGATADLSESSAITINELRFANALQVFKERKMRFGRRRQEHYKGFYDVTPEDLRLMLPKYIGGGRIPINIADIEQTSSNSGTQVLGSLAGKATAVAGGFAGFSTFCSEESIIMGMCFAMPHITYSKSVSRFLFKTNDVYDYHNPSFEHLGEQAIENLEVYSGATAAGEFAYTPRYNEYRFHSNEMHGEFKSTLSFWTLGRIFDSQPALNADFVYMQPENFDRIFPVSGVDNMLVSMIFNVKLIQPVSKFGTPMLLA